MDRHQSGLTAAPARQNHTTSRLTVAIRYAGPATVVAFVVPPIVAGEANRSASVGADDGSVRPFKTRLKCQRPSVVSPKSLGGQVRDNVVCELPAWDCWTGTVNG